MWGLTIERGRAVKRFIWFLFTSLKGDETGVRVVTTFFPRKVSDSDLEMVNGMLMYMSIHCIVTSHHNILKVHIALV